MCGITKVFWICAFIVLIKSCYSDDAYTPEDFCVRLVTENSILVRWVEPAMLRSEIHGYTVYYTNNIKSFIQDWNFVTIGNFPMTTIRNIILGDTYYFRVQVNSLGLDKLGPLSDVFPFKLVNETRSCYDRLKVPTATSFNILRAAATSYSSVEVWWNLPYDPHKVKGFMVLYATSEQGYWFNKTTGIVNSVELTDLMRSTTYTIIIAAITDNGLKYYPNEVQVEVNPEEVPMELEATDVTADSILIKWLPPLRLYPLKYKIAYDGFKSYIDEDGAKQQQYFDNLEEIVDGHVTSFELVDLDPYTYYYINVSAVPIDSSYRPSIKITVKTDVGPPGPLRQPTVVGGTNIQILLPKASEKNGPVSHYYVIVVPEDDQNHDRPTNAYSTEDLLQNQYLEEKEINTPYIAAKYPSKIPYAFILGMGVYGGFKNYKLQEDKRYRVFVRAVVVTPHGHLFTDSPYSNYFSLSEEKESIPLKKLN